MKLDISSIPDWFARTAPGQAAIAEARETELAERRRLVAEIGQLEEERDEAMPPLRAARDNARERAAEAARAHREARAARDAAEREVLTTSTRYDRRIRDLEAELRHSAPPAIEALRDELFEAHEETRHADAGWEQVKPTNHTTGAPAVWGPSSHAAIVRRLEAIRAALRAAEALKLEALTEEELEARIAEIRGGIPPIAGTEASRGNGRKAAAPEDGPETATPRLPDDEPEPRTRPWPLHGPKG